MCFFGLKNKLYDSTPIGGFHGDEDDTECESCIDGMYGDFRERGEMVTLKKIFRKVKTESLYNRFC